MRDIISWNVNGIRAVEKKNFVSWLLGTGADLVCIQETKARPEQLSEALIEPFSENKKYFSFWASAKKPGYSGTAIYSQKEPDNISIMGYPEFDDEGRFLMADYGTTSVVSAYFPNSQDGGARLGYKLDFCRALLEKLENLRDKGRNVVLCGDYNIAHKAIDLARPKSNEGNPGYLPEERAWMDTFTGAGYVDVFRHFCAEPEQYTWWSYRFNAREKNIGWRIDYTCVHKSFLDQVESASIMNTITGSDHCPVRIVLK